MDLLFFDQVYRYAREASSLEEFKLDGEAFVDSYLSDGRFGETIFVDISKDATHGRSPEAREEAAPLPETEQTPAGATTSRSTT